MMVRQDVALGMNDESAAHTARWPTWPAAKHIEQRIALVFFVFVFIAEFGLRLGGFNVDNRGFHATSNFGERSGKRFGRTRDLHVALRDRWPACTHPSDDDARDEARTTQRGDPDSQLSQYRSLLF